MAKTLDDRKTVPSQKVFSGRGIQRTTRKDWLDASLETLISEGVAQVKVLNIAKKLECSRSSFYWYFKDRSKLLEALLDYWEEKNTASIVLQAQEPAKTITAAMVNVFRCWADTDLFDSKLDFAIREWSRRDNAIRRAVDISDEARVAALTGMFRRYGYSSNEATIRARVTYYSQIGHYALDASTDDTERARSGEHYLFVLTGQAPKQEEVSLLKSIIANGNGSDIKSSN